MATPTKQKANKTYKCGKSGREIKPGELYWKLSFRFGGTQIRAIEHPFKPSECTQSEFMGTLLGITETYNEELEGEYEDIESLEATKDALYGEVETLRDETQDKLDNMPEGLQSGDTGQLLQDRIDALDNVLSDLDCIDFDYEGLEEPTKESVQQDLDREDYPNNVMFDEAVEEVYQEKHNEWEEEMQDCLEEKIEEIKEEIYSVLASLEEIC